MSNKRVVVVLKVGVRGDREVAHLELEGYTEVATIENWVFFMDVSKDKELSEKDNKVCDIALEGEIELQVLKELEEIGMENANSKVLNALAAMCNNLEDYAISLDHWIVLAESGFRVELYVEWVRNTAISVSYSPRRGEVYVYNREDELIFSIEEGGIPGDILGDNVKGYGELKQYILDNYSEELEELINKESV